MDMFSGFRKKISGGNMLFVSPKPLPTGFASDEFGDNVSYVGNGYLDLSGAPGSSSSWRVMLCFPLHFFIFSALVLPGLLFIIASVGSGTQFGYDIFRSVSRVIIPGALCISVFSSFYLYFSVNRGVLTKSSEIPTRFNRQRREVCFVPPGKQKPIFVFWEDLIAWVWEAKGVTEFGVHNFSGYGFAFRDPVNGEEYSLEYDSFGFALAMGSWEAIRSYMEYSSRIDVDLDSDVGDSGCAEYYKKKIEDRSYFYSRRLELHRRYHDGEIGRFSFVSWYLYHMFTFWTWPNMLVEWEASEIDKLSSDNMPKAMKEWSEPLPSTDWRAPSEEFLAQSKRVTELRHEQPDRPIHDIFSQVSAEFRQKKPTVKANSG